MVTELECTKIMVGTEAQLCCDVTATHRAHVAVSPSRSGANRPTCCTVGGTFNFSFQVDSTPDAKDGWRMLQRCACGSAAGAGRPERPVRDRVRCLRCTRAGGRRVVDIVRM